jgi:hypothetical protein
MRSWPIIRYHPLICLEARRRTTRNLSQNIRCPGRDSNTAPIENKCTVFLLDKPVWSNNVIMSNISHLASRRKPTTYKTVNFLPVVTVRSTSLWIKQGRAHVYVTAKCKNVKQHVLEFNIKQKLGFRLFCAWGVLLAQPVKKRDDKWFEQTIDNN